MATKRKSRPRYKSGPKKGKFMSNRAIAAKRTSSKRKTTKRKPTRALTKRGKSNPVARKKKRSRRRGRRGGGGSGISTGEVKDLMIGGAIYGFVTEEDAEDTELRATVVATLNKVPVIGNRDISNGLAFWALDKYVWSNKYLRMTAKAALVSGAVRFGRRGLTLGGTHDGLGGWGDSVDVTEQGEEVSGIVG